MCFIRNSQGINKSELEQIVMEMAKGSGNPKPVFLKLYKNIIEDCDNLQFNNLLSKIKRDQSIECPLENFKDIKNIKNEDSSDTTTENIPDEDISVFFDDRFQQEREIEDHEISLGKSSGLKEEIEEVHNENVNVVIHTNISATKNSAGKDKALEPHMVYIPEEDFNETRGMVSENNREDNSMCSFDEINQYENILYCMNTIKPTSTPIINEDSGNSSDSVLEFYFNTIIIEIAYPCIDDMIPEKINVCNKQELFTNEKIIEEISCGGNSIFELQKNDCTQKTPNIVPPLINSNMLNTLIKRRPLDRSRSRTIICSVPEISDEVVIIPNCNNDIDKEEIISREDENAKIEHIIEEINTECQERPREIIYSPTNNILRRNGLFGQPETNLFSKLWRRLIRCCSNRKSIDDGGEIHMQSLYNPNPVS